MREFLKDPLSMVESDRGKYVTAANTIMRAFQIAKSPRQTKPLKNYDQWSMMVRDPLIWLGCADPVKTQEKSRTKDSKLYARQQVVRRWWEYFQSNQITARQVIADATERVPLPEEIMPTEDAERHQPCVRPGLFAAMLEVAEKGGHLDGRLLGNWLSKNEGRVINAGDGPMYFERATEAGHVLNWRLKRKADNSPRESVVEAPRLPF